VLYAVVANAYLCLQVHGWDHGGTLVFSQIRWLLSPNRLVARETIRKSDLRATGTSDCRVMDSAMTFLTDTVP
jgi:hypothetical protein